MGSRIRSVLMVAVFIAAIPAGSSFLFSTGAGSGHAISTQYSGIHNYHNASFSEVIDQITHSTGNVTNESVSLEAHYSAFSSVESEQTGDSRIIFQENGLPTGSTWYVTIDGQTHLTNGTYLILNITPGNYSYALGTDSSYIAKQPYGSISLMGGTLTLPVTFESALSVNDTLYLINGTLRNGNHVPLNSSSSPIGILWDSVNNCSYVADSSMNVVEVINQSAHLVKRISVGQNPSQIIADTNNGYIYVTNSGSDNVSVIGGNNKVIASINVGDFPFGISYDPQNGMIYVANLFSSTISVIATSTVATGKVVSTIQLKTDVLPLFAVYDKSTNLVYFSDVNGDVIVGVQGISVSGYLTVKGSPAMMAYDGINGNVYVADSQTSASTGYGYLSVIDSRGAVTSNITIPGSENPFGVSYDSNRNLVYITDGNSNQLIVFNPNNSAFINRVKVGSDPYGITVITTGHRVEVTNFNSGTVSLLSYSGQVNSVTFEEKGLRAGTQWAVTVNNVSLTSTTDKISFNEAPGTYIYQASPIKGYSLNGNANTFSISTRNVTVPVTFQKLYKVDVSESGLPAGSEWGFLINGTDYNTSSSHIYLSLTNGTYHLEPNTTMHDYVSNTLKIQVDGNNESLNIKFFRTYGLYFVESGLKEGTLWSVNINGTFYSSTSREIPVMLENGSYEYSIPAIQGYLLANNSGNVTITGKSPTIDVNFTKLFSVKLRETGLYPNTDWNITMGGATIKSHNDSITLYLANGTYNYTVDVPAGYTIRNTESQFSVSGKNVTVLLSFSKVYEVIAVETGLSAGYRWWVKIGEINLTSSSNIIALNLTNGTYHYNAENIPGYRLVNGSGSFSISGSRVSIELKYEKIFHVKFVESGLPSGHSWQINFNGTSNKVSASSDAIAVVNGTYDYSIRNVGIYVPSPQNGVVNVSGSNTSVVVEFQKEITTVNVIVHNVPVNATWYISVNGTSHKTSGNSSISLQVPVGNYSYAAGYTLYGHTYEVYGNISVGTEQVNLTLIFPTLYMVKFVENGLENGASWSVNLSGYNITSSSRIITFRAPNGSYSFSIYDSSNQSFHAVLQYWGTHGHDYSASSMELSTSDVPEHGLPQILVSGGNVTAKILFNEANNHHKKYGGGNMFSPVEQTLAVFMAYLGELVQTTISYFVVFAKTFYLNVTVPATLFLFQF